MTDADDDKAVYQRAPVRVLRRGDVDAPLLYDPNSDKLVAVSGLLDVFGRVQFNDNVLFVFSLIK